VRQWIATFVAAGVSTAIFVLVRNHLDLEDSRFLTALLACSTLAFAFSAASSFLLQGSARSSLGFAVLALVLVPLLYVVYLVVFAVSVCIIGGETCYS
jgi:hypothetical protein